MKNDQIGERQGVESPVEAVKSSARSQDGTCLACGEQSKGQCCGDAMKEGST